MNGLVVMAHIFLASLAVSITLGKAMAAQGHAYDDALEGWDEGLEEWCVTCWRYLDECGCA
jgi:hypothetical protein